MFEKKQINVFSFAIAIGMTCAIWALLLGLIAWLFDYGTQLVQIFSTLYVGYAPTFVGSIIGALWAFVDCFIGGAIVAWLYNLFSKRIKA